MQNLFLNKITKIRDNKISKNIPLPLEIRSKLFSNRRGGYLAPKSGESYKMIKIFKNLKKACFIKNFLKFVILKFSNLYHCH